jgi:hypothetical protein
MIIARNNFPMSEEEISFHESLNCSTQNAMNGVQTSAGAYADFYGEFDRKYREIMLSEAEEMP